MLFLLLVFVLFSFVSVLRYSPAPIVAPSGPSSPVVLGSVFSSSASFSGCCLFQSRSGGRLSGAAFSARAGSLRSRGVLV